MNEKVIYLDNSDIKVDESIINLSFSIYILNTAYKENMITKDEYIKIKSSVRNMKK